jgi:hypothetical protein
MKQDLRKRLSRYTALAVATSAIGEAKAAIIYTDEDPDFVGGIGSQYFLDLDNDGVNDFKIYHDGGSNLMIEPLVNGNGIMGSGSSSYAYPFNLANGAPISSGAGAFMTIGYSGGYQSLNYGSCSFGNWCSVTDGFLGLHFNAGGNMHYGWVRLDVDANGEHWVVKDYAYDNVAGEPIDAGEATNPIVADGASNVIGTDIDNNGNGLDLQVDFAAAGDESTVAEYRVMIVKNAMSFDLADAQAVGAASYFTVTPNGSSNYTQIHTAGAIDVDGDPILENTGYQAYVLSIADGTNAQVDSLSAPSTNFALFSTIGINTNVLNEISTLVTGDNFIVKIPRAIQDEMLTLKIISLDGKILMTKKLSATLTTLDVSSFSNGIYIAYFLNDLGEVKSLKFKI